MDEFYRITANNRRMNLVFGLAEHLHYADRSSNPEIPEWNRLPQKGGLESQERYVGEAEACILRMENERGYNPSL